MELRDVGTWSQDDRRGNKKHSSSRWLHKRLLGNTYSVIEKQMYDYVSYHIILL